MALLRVMSASPSQPTRLRPPANGPAYNNGLQGQRYAPLKQIDATNVTRLGMVCRVQIDGPGSFHARPDRPGQHHLHRHRARDRGGECHRLPPALEVRLPARRGALRRLQPRRGAGWRTACSGAPATAPDRAGCRHRQAAVEEPVLATGPGESTAAAPLAWQGVVYMGIGGSDLGVRGRVVAFDAASGRELWRFHTIPMGSETGAETWLKPETAKTGGGGVWGAMSLDVSDRRAVRAGGQPLAGHRQGLPSRRQPVHQFGGGGLDGAHRRA